MKKIALFTLVAFVALCSLGCRTSTKKEQAWGVRFGNELTFFTNTPGTDEASAEIEFDALEELLLKGEDSDEAETPGT